MMQDSTIHRYIKECQRLDRDLRLLIEDYELELNTPGAVRFAVDFSEIYAYVFPGQVSGHLRLFGRESLETVALHELFVSSKVFSPKEKSETVLTAAKPVLLRAYASELHRYVTRTTIAISDDLRRAERHLDSLLESPDFVSFFERTKRRLPRGNDFEDVISADQQEGTDDLLDFIERQAPRLALLLTQVSDIAPRRLLQLLESGCFDDVEVLGVQPTSFDPRVLERWDEALFSRRGKEHAASGYIDALAVATLSAANSQLQAATGPCKTLRLITRSSVMHDVMEAEVEMGLWPFGNPLRSPRYLIPLHTVEGQSSSDQVKQLKDLHDSVHVFLKTYSETGLLPDRRRYEHEMMEIRTVLEKSAGLASWLMLTRDANKSLLASKGVLRKELSDLVGVSTSETEIRKGLVGRLAQLADQLERLYQYLGIALEASSLERRGQTQNVLSVEHLKHKVTVTLRRPELLYSLQFRTPELTEFASRVRSTSALDVDDVLSLLRGSLANPHDYEMLLFSALVLGAWQEWHQAEMYCELALTRWKPSDLGRQEGLFFLAICQRMIQPADPERYAKALRLIREAARLKALERERSHESYAGDPRYLKEEATIALLWDEKIRNGDKRFLGSKAPMSAAEALQLSEAALSLVRDDVKLRMQLVNNLCYGYVTLGEAKCLDRAKDYLDQLLRMLSTEIDTDPTKWPINMLDTIVWAAHRLSGDLTHPVLHDYDKEEMIGLLEASVGDIDIPLTTQAVIRYHLDEIRSGVAPV